MRRFSTLFMLGLLAVVSYVSKAGDTLYDRKEVLTLTADLTFTCLEDEYLAKVSIMNDLKVDIKANAFDIGLNTPPHQSSFHIEILDHEDRVISYKGRTVNKDGVDTKNEQITIKSGESINFEYQLSKYYEVSPLDKSQYLVRYEVGATSDKGPLVIFIDSKEYKLESKICNY